MLFIVLLICTLHWRTCTGSSVVSVTNDGPAVIGAPIMFSAVVTFHDEVPPSKLIYQWKNNARPPYSSQTGPISDLTCNLTLTFSDSDQVGYYLMEVEVYEPRIVRPDRLIGVWSTPYRITVSLNGEIELSQPGVHYRKNYILSTINSTNILMNLHDPHNFLAGASRIDYYWSLNGEVNLPYNKAKFKYNFTRLGENRLHCTVVAHYRDNNLTDIATGSGGGDALTPDSLMWGIFYLSFTVADPIRYVHITGDTWLRNGAMLNLTILCNGTAPWHFCVRVHRGSYNVTGNETCSGGAQRSDVTCSFHFYRYLARNSTYTAVVIVSNDVSRRLAKVDISVNVLPVQQLSYYIVPLSCALLAFIFIIFGSIKFIKSRRNYNVEIADFDLEPSDDQAMDGETELGFWRRVRVSVLPDCCQPVRQSQRRLTVTEPILARGRTHRRSYGIVEGYLEDD